ncbi:MAG: ABC-type transport auxiliary lipoprotein family protein [Alphaproteobacteria bacterium]
MNTTYPPATRRRAIPSALMAAGMALAAMAGSGCSSIIPGANREPPTLFDLSPKSTFAAGLPKARWQLIVERPIAAAGLSSSRIALKRHSLRLEYYAKTSWTDLAPKMVQTLMVESFENSNKIVSVGRESAGLRSDFVLKTELREFQAEYFAGEKTAKAGAMASAKAGAPGVRVRINAKLVLMPQRIIIAGVSIERFVTAKSNSMAAIVEAYDYALGKTLKILVAWTLRSGDKAWKRRSRRARRGG